MSETRIIKKYPNRRLYDTGLSRYVTLQDIRGLVDADTSFQVVEQRSGTDITRNVLLQVTAEREENGEALLSQRFLTQLIRRYGTGSATQIAALLEQCLSGFNSATASQSG
jgi:polyhydroxyalkanoate synthesis repressor PhaR